MSMYPDEQTLVIGGEEVTYPGLDAGKFTDGDPADPTKKPSFIPSASINLVLDNLGDFITRAGLTPNNTGTRQLWDALWASIKPGVVWMFDGTGWEDNVTLPGFYACIPENEDGGANGHSFGIKSMVDRFPMGKAIAGAGVQGGANSYSLTVGQIPYHDHSINHDHPSVTSGTQSANHTHYVSGTTANDTHNHSASGTGYGFERQGSGFVLGGQTYSSWSITTTNYTHSHSWSDTSGGNSASHNHDVNLPTFSGNSGATGNGDAIDNRPSFYSMVFVRKCA